MINELPPLPAAMLLTAAQQRAARGVVFALPDYGEVEYRGLCPLGQLSIAQVVDRDARGAFTLPPRAALALARLILAVYDGKGRAHAHLWTMPDRRTPTS